MSPMSYQLLHPASVGRVLAASFRLSRLLVRAQPVAGVDLDVHVGVRRGAPADVAHAALGRAVRVAEARLAVGARRRARRLERRVVELAQLALALDQRAARRAGVLLVLADVVARRVGPAE